MGRSWLAAGAVEPEQTLVQNVRDCYGGTHASFLAAEPQANPWNRLEEL